MTPERLKRLYSERLGDERGHCFEQLWKEFRHLRTLFDSLKDGFGGYNPPMISVEAVSPQFREHYWNLLVEGIVASACRLLDKPETHGKKNVTITAIPEWFDEEALPQNLWAELGFS